MKCLKVITGLDPAAHTMIVLDLEVISFENLHEVSAWLDMLGLGLRVKAILGRGSCAEYIIRTTNSEVVSEGLLLALDCGFTLSRAFL